MKRTISAFCLCLSHFLLLAACGPGTPPPAPAEFTAEAHILFGESAFTALVTQTRPGVLAVEFTAPEALAGLRLSLQSGNVTLHDGALQSELPAAALPASNFAALLSGVLLRLAQPSTEGLTRTRGGGWTLAGTANGLHYQATISAEGTLTHVAAPSAGLEITLTRTAAHSS